jgi:hypothetical protein
MRIYPNRMGGVNTVLRDRTKMYPDRMNVLTHGELAPQDRLSIVPDPGVKCLPLYGDVLAQRRLYDRQRLGLEVRRLAVRGVVNDGSAKLDPVLRFHLGLDGKEDESR